MKKIVGCMIACILCINLFSQNNILFNWVAGADLAKQWTWVSGSDTIDKVGSYGTMFTASASTLTRIKLLK